MQSIGVSREGRVGHRQEAPARRPKLHMLMWPAFVVLVVVGLTVVLANASSPRAQVSDEQRLVITKLESVLLHDTEAPQYDRVVNQFDASGYTAGIGDFSTARGEALEVVQTYTARVGPNALSQAYLATLVELARDQSPAIDRLSGLPEAWRQASADRRFRAAQDDVMTARFFDPALDLARDLGLSTALGVAMLHDAALQHGLSGGPDALPALVQRTIAAAGGRPGSVGEAEWLTAFLDAREDVLASPTEAAHQEVWPHSLGRVRALRALLATGNDALRPPLSVNPYGTPHVIDGRPIDDPPLITVPGGPVTPVPGPSPTGRVTPTRSVVSSPGPPAATPPSPAPTAAPAPPRPVAPRAGIVVRIVNIASGKAIGVSGGSRSDGARLVQSSNLDGSAQQWRVYEAAQPGCFHFVNLRSGRAIDNPDGTSENGVQMQQWEYYWGNLNQTWCARGVGANAYSLQNLAGYALLDLRGGSLADGAEIQQWGADAAAPNANQTWQFFEVS